MSTSGKICKVLVTNGSLNWYLTTERASSFPFMILKKKRKGKKNNEKSYLKRTGYYTVETNNPLRNNHNNNNNKTILYCGKNLKLYNNVKLIVQLLIFSFALKKCTSLTRVLVCLVSFQ